MLEIKGILLILLFTVFTIFYVNTYAFNPEDYPWRVDGYMVLLNNHYDVVCSFEEMYSRFDNGSVIEISNYSDMYAYVVRRNVGESTPFGEVSFLRLFYDAEDGSLIYQWTFYKDEDSEELEKDIETFHEYFRLER
jgi:hypothetical protein